jgi:hypothetical protein
VIAVMSIGDPFDGLAAALPATIASKKPAKEIINGLRHH